MVDKKKANSKLFTTHLTNLIRIYEMKTIDLHGKKHNEAIELVEDELLLASTRGDFNYKIITGQSKAMRNKIIEVCERWGFGYVIPGNNQGEINIQWNKL